MKNKGQSWRIDLGMVLAKELVSKDMLAQWSINFPFFFSPVGSELNSAGFSWDWLLLRSLKQLHAGTSFRKSQEAVRFHISPYPITSQQEEDVDGYIIRGPGEQEEDSPFSPIPPEWEYFSILNQEEGK
jgi:hypothetical protein